jgi:site-specific DNA-methyltransferase (adenine-specific)
MIEILNIDCMEYMKSVPDKYFDLAIVDPPYGIGDFRSTRSKKIHSKINWNDNIPDEKYFKELYRVSKNRIIWGANYFRNYVSDVGAIVHDKTGGGKRRGPKEMSDCDIASHSFGVNMKIYHYISMGNVIGEKIDWDNILRWHPCQKPISLYKWVIENYAKPGNKLLDTHLGSGSIALACHDLGYDLVGCEIDKDYYDAAVKRFNNHKLQTTLF